MSKLLYVEPTDEITDLVDRIRRAEGERDLVFVVPPDGRVLRSGLDLQLLMQYAKGFQKRVSVVSSDPQIQALAMRTGFPTFASIAQMEQNAPLHSVVGGTSAGAAAVGTAVALTGKGAATVVESPPAPPEERAVARRSPATMAVSPSGGGASRHWWQSPTTRRWTIGTGVAIFVVGVLAILLLLPTATIDVGVQSHKLSDAVTIQGNVSGGSGSVLDVIPVQALLTPTETQTFTVSPSGTQVLPPTPATGNLYLCYQYTGPGNYNGAATLTFTGAVTPEFSDQSGSGNLGFTTTSAGQSGSYTLQSCNQGQGQGQASASTSSPALLVQADSNSLGAQGNVGANQQ